jgi:trans-2,3-dihydro-3-hydroxyanthranilate isomerase
VKSALVFDTLDVFTDKKFFGNPLAVVSGADRLSREEMLAIAREFNLSETVFLMEPRNPINSARLRIFTPASELPFAGHPTIGAAILIAQTRASEMLARHEVVVVLEEEIGPIRCEVRTGRGGIPFAHFTVPETPRQIGVAPALELLARALSLDARDIGFAYHAPSIYSAGLPFVFVPVRTRAAVDGARIDPAAFSAATAGVGGAYLYTNETVDAVSAVYARMFPRALGFVEDPATGAAAAAFAGVAHEFETPEDGDHEFFIEQGHKMGRPSRVTLRMSVENGRLGLVQIGGQAVRVSGGTLRL